MSTSESLKNYPPDRRKCFFPGEKHLYYFKIYTQQNCEVECLANFTYQKCGCVDFHMPSKLNEATMNGKLIVSLSFRIQQYTNLWTRQN